LRADGDGLRDNLGPFPRPKRDTIRPMATLSAPGPSPLRQLLFAAVTFACVAGSAAAAAPPAAPPPVPGFPIGCFIRVQDAASSLEVMKAAGMEFVEVGLRDVVALSDKDFEALVARSRALSLPVRAAINFLRLT
jgi:hypothetical protein